MSSDLTKVVVQVGSMVTRLKDGHAERQQRLQKALDIAGDEAIDLAELKKKIAASRTTWLVADLVEAIASRYGIPSTPAEFTVMASDGSHIDVDRHLRALTILAFPQHHALIIFNLAVLQQALRERRRVGHVDAQLTGIVTYVAVKGPYSGRLWQDAR